MSTVQRSMNSPIGTLYLVASEKGLQGIFWKKQNWPSKTSPILSQAIRQLKEYFRGKRTSFDFPLDMEGTPFQKSVWRQLLKIPYGKTASYKDIAQRIHRPQAVRAVGTANGKNPLCIIVPCHRVIAHNGTLGGYSGWLKIKRRLLKLEASLLNR